MDIPVSVVLDRVGYGQGPLDLSPLIAENSLTWSSVVPGGFADCGFTLDGDFRALTKLVPYLSILRVIGDSGRVLFEGQIEDKNPTLTEQGVGMKVGAFGLQNALKETTLRAIWSKRDMDWTAMSPIPAVDLGGGYLADPYNFSTSIGNFDPTDPTKSGVQLGSVGGVSVPTAHAQCAEFVLPIGMTALKWLGTLNVAGTDAGATKWRVFWNALESGSWANKANSILTGINTFSVTPSSATAIRCGVAQNSGAAVTLVTGDLAQFYDMRILGVSGSTTEDASGGFFGDSLIKSILGLVPALGQGVIESGSDFTIDHLDASVRRAAYDILQEVAQYYSREWAVWEDALLHWKTPVLTQTQWIVPIALCETLDLDASVVNSKKRSIVLYTDAASGFTGEQSISATDRRNPYVLNGRVKDEIVDGGTMTANTALQFATLILNDLGFGPVPAAGTISVPGDSIIQHAQGNALKAWEIRAGDNITIPDLPLADVFTQDGRGECLFHVISAEAEISTGTVTFTLDSYGSKRSDVLMARLAAVTAALGG